DSCIQQDVQWSIIGMPKEELDKNIMEYVTHVQAWIEKSVVFNPMTKEYEPPSEKKMRWLEDIMGVKESESAQHRKSVIVDLAAAYQDARSEAEKDGISGVPQLDITVLFSDYYDFIYESLLEDSINRMPVTLEELQRSIQWMGTHKEMHINPPAREEIERITSNMKKRAPYCDKCAKTALEYVFFDLMWELTQED
ncbi:MAG: hypothetical protein V1906_02385, partial [Candidatus Woesearchaeota archaeon]